MVAAKIEVLVSMCGFSVDAGFNSSLGGFFLPLLLSRQAIDRAFPSSTVSLMCSLVELRCLCNSLFEMRSKEAVAPVIDIPV